MSNIMYGMDGMSAADKGHHTIIEMNFSLERRKEARVRVEGRLKNNGRPFLA